MHDSQSSKNIFVQETFPFSQWNEKKVVLVVFFLYIFFCFLKEKEKILKVFLFIFMYLFRGGFVCSEISASKWYLRCLPCNDLNSNVNLLNYHSFASFCRNGTTWTYDGTHQNMVEYVIWEYHLTGYGNPTFLCTIGELWCFVARLRQYCHYKISFRLLIYHFVGNWWHRLCESS